MVLIARLERHDTLVDRSSLVTAAWSSVNADPVTWRGEVGVGNLTVDNPHDPETAPTNRSRAAGQATMPDGDGCCDYADVRKLVRPLHIPFAILAGDLYRGALSGGVHPPDFWRLRVSWQVAGTRRSGQDVTYPCSRPPSI